MMAALFLLFLCSLLLVYINQRNLAFSLVVLNLLLCLLMLLHHTTDILQVMFKEI